MEHTVVTAIEHLKAKPLAGSVVAGLLASLCCGGSLIFVSIGLGVFYSSLGLSQQKMFISTAIGLAVMAGSFVFMEWLNHAVVHGDRFLARPQYSQALIKGVPNMTLLYVCATFFALAILWALPFPREDSSGMQDSGRMGKAARVAILGATTVLLVGVLVDASSKVSGTVSGQHGRAHFDR